MNTNGNNNKLNYEYSDKYDVKYSVKDKDVSYLSKSRLDELYPDGNYIIYGETISGNKKKQFANIKLGDEQFGISRYGSHSRLLYRQAGYIKAPGGAYVALLKIRILPLIILAALMIALAGVGVKMLIGTKADTPNFETADNQRNAVYVYMPEGYIKYKMRSDISKFEGHKLEIYIKDNKKYQKLHTQKVTLDENNNIGDSQIDFPSLHYELKANSYKGKIEIGLGGENRELQAMVYIVHSQKGSSGISYKKVAKVNLSKKVVELYYSQNKDTTHDAIIQLILKRGNSEILLAESGVLYPGEEIKKLSLKDEAIPKLKKGKYDGILRAYIDNGVGITGVSTEFEQTIVIK